MHTYLNDESGNVGVSLFTRRKETCAASVVYSHPMSRSDRYSISGHNKTQPVCPILERLGWRPSLERLSIGRSIYWIVATLMPIRVQAESRRRKQPAEAPILLAKSWSFGICHDQCSSFCVASLVPHIR